MIYTDSNSLISKHKDSEFGSEDGKKALKKPEKCRWWWLQVQELHRLYSVQKMLMNELKGEIKQTRLWSPRADVIRHTGCGDNFWAQEDQSSREMSSSFSGDKQRITRGVDLKGGDQEDNKISVVEESEVELTLSIGTPTSSKRKQDNHLPNRSLELACSELTSGEVPDLGLRSSASFRGDECSDVPAAATETEDYRKQQQQQPHWLFQGLSLNRTQL